MFQRGRGVDRIWLHPRTLHNRSIHEYFHLSIPTSSWHASITRLPECQHSRSRFTRHTTQAGICKSNSKPRLERLSVNFGSALESNLIGNFSHFFQKRRSGTRATNRYLAITTVVHELPTL